MPAKKTDKLLSPKKEAPTPADFSKRLPRVGDVYCRAGDYPNPREWWMITSIPVPWRSRDYRGGEEVCWWCTEILHFPGPSIIKSWPFEATMSALILLAEID